MSYPAMGKTRKPVFEVSLRSLACWALSFFIALVVLAVDSSAAALEKAEFVPFTKYFSVGAKVKQLFNSHTSYEFGNPFPPYQAPLSRLEFPVDSWWGGLEMRLNHPRFSVGIEGLTSAPQDADGHMRDSDWDDDGVPFIRNTYSESRCRVAPSYMLRVDADLEISDWLGLPGWLNIRPLVGFRWQKFNLVPHDGRQSQYGDTGPPFDLYGDSIRFKQRYWQYFLGIRSNIDLSKLTGVPSLRLLMQFDWAYVEGKNEDNHLLRPGQRFTYEDTYGEAWHGNLGIKKDLSEHFTIGIDLDYLTIRTKGNHRLVNNTFGLDFSFSHGVEVWSDQLSAAFTLEYRF